MTKESVRKCSHCGYNGHNLRTCNGKGCFKLFGVTIDLNTKDDSFIRKKENESIRKSKSMGNLQACNHDIGVVETGYHSDGYILPKERKKGVPWTEDEHRAFLAGLQKLGKGDWKGISKNYVRSRTPTQVASHAQKYFNRKIGIERKKRRSSLFDMPLKEKIPSPQPSPGSWSNKASEITQQVGTIPFAPLKNLGEIQGQAITSAHVATAEKPPLSPVARPRVYGNSDLLHMQHLTSPGQRFSATEVMPRPPFMPMVNPPNTGYVYVPMPIKPNSNRNYVTCMPHRSQLSTGLLSQPHPRSPSPPEPVTKNDGLETSIGALLI